MRVYQTFDRSAVLTNDVQIIGAQARWVSVSDVCTGEAIAAGERFADLYALLEKISHETRGGWGCYSARARAGNMKTTLDRSAR